MTEAQEMSEAQKKMAKEKQEKTSTKNPAGGNIEKNNAPTPAVKVALEATPAAATDSKKGGLDVISIAALILAIGVLAGGFVVWQQLNTQQHDLDQRLLETEKAMSGFESSSATSLSIAQSTQGANQALQQRLQALETNLDSGLSRLEQSDKNLNESLTTLNSNLNQKKGNDWLIAEARHLINIANHQSRLNNNSEAASTALDTADQRLRDTGDPSLIPIRQILAADIIALRSVPPLDITGIALTLSQLENQIGQLPLLSEKESATGAEQTVTVADSEANAVTAFFSKVWADIKGLVTVRRNDGDQGTALLPPDQRFFLQQNLRLKLEIARLALLQRDTQTFHDSLVTATQWIEAYFDTSAANTANALTTLAPYQVLNLNPSLPDISNALRALDDWQQKHTTRSSEEQPS